jgi:hypothetical protein
MGSFQPIPGTFVLGVSGKARHGKDTFARALLEQRPDLVQRFAFADALKTFCRVRHGMTRKDAPLLQRIGVLERATDLEVWIRAVYWAIEEARPTIAVITDLRFENEAALVKALGGMLVRVRRWNADGSPYVDPSRDPNHPSETNLDGYQGWNLVVDASDTATVQRAAGQVLSGVLELA